MRYILILAALTVLIGFHSEASEPIPETAYNLNDTGPVKIDPFDGSKVYTDLKTLGQSDSAASPAIKSEEAGESGKTPKAQELTLAKLILTQDKPAQLEPAPASVPEPNTTPGTNPDNGEFPLSTSSIFILFCGLIGMVAIRRNFTP